MFCHRFRNDVVILLAVGWLIAPPHATAKPSSDSLFVAARSGDGTELWSHLPKKKLKAARDEAGNTLLHEAALYGQAKVVKALLEGGLKVDARNDYGATPLIYGAGHLDVARTLIEHGADVNAKSKYGNTPLIAAASYKQSSRSVALLLRKGAKLAPLNKRFRNALYRAVESGSVANVQLLLAHGASPDPNRVESKITNYAWYPLNAAAKHGDQKIAKLLLSYGADPNGRGFTAGELFTGMNPLSWALAGNHIGVAEVLLKHGAAAEFTAGRHQIPAMMWAAYDEAGRTKIAELLVKKGASINRTNSRGETPLNWAERRGPTELRKYLLRQGAKKEIPTFKDKRIPQRNVPDGKPERQALAQDAVKRALGLLQQTSSAFIKQENCVTCHQQDIPAVAFGYAQAKGFPLKKEPIDELVDASFQDWRHSPHIVPAGGKPEPGSPRPLGYGLWGLHALGQPANAVTRAFVFWISRKQQSDGGWAQNTVVRPPMGGGDMMSTALALRALKLYPIPGIEEKLERQVDRAGRWLSGQTAENTTARAFQLLGLGWTDTHPEKRADIAAAIRAHQRRDGGWSQLPGLRSDAWATGLSLLALHEGYGLKTDHNAYRRGVNFLLRTQFRDGSWWVESRSWPFQRHFDSKFPHGKDQWISAPATAWAAIALIATLDQYDPKLKEQLPPNRGYGNVNRPTEEQDDYAAESKEISTPDGNITFEKNILPLFERSCAECHSGDEPKGELRVTSKEALLEGGQSGDPTLVPGKPAESKILRLVTDQVEDMEMPPLNKRDNFQRLSPKEVGLIRAWIQLGAL